jgi:lipoprotein-anchoring transpeptidase ErfK/SrfK
MLAGGGGIRYVEAIRRGIDWRLVMNLQHAAAAVALGIVVSLVAFGANAAPRTYFDPASRSYVTYDPDKVQRDAIGAPPAASGSATAVAQIPAAIRHRKVDAKFDRQVVAYNTPEEPGTIVIDTGEKLLYYVMEGGQALRMGVGVGREGFGWTGTVYVGSKQENPKWFPPDDMVTRQPELAKYQAEGMSGGEDNPLGVRALYLNDEKGKDTLYRIHGTIEPWSIGLNVSSGCIRMLNENVTNLYDLAPIGTKVVVI